MPSREEVYKVIDGEREYQESFVKNKFDNPEYPHNLAAEILMMKVYLDRTMVAWTDNKGDDAALDVIRKVAGIAVRAMENHGVIERKV